MKKSDDPDWLALERLYEEGRQFVLGGKQAEALSRFEEIFGITTDFRDVTEIIDDWYCTTPGQWLAKYQARFQK